MKQNTLVRTYPFEGKGLHTGKFVHMRVCPAPENTGIRFVRTDMGPDAVIEAIAQNVSSTARSTTISAGKASVSTIEHLLAALTGLGVDNALIEVDGPEVPILDGSAKPYTDAIVPDGLAEQNAERKWLELSEEVEYKDSKTGSYLRLSPADDFSMEVTIDFGSRVLGVQTVKYDSRTDFASQVAPCRTFCFLHEVQWLAALGLVKGGDVKNAIVVVEKPVTERKLARLSRIFNQPELSVSENGYLSNLTLRFPDECGRHKLLDLLGDLRLIGGFVKAQVSAFKPGHAINTRMAGYVQEKIINI